MLINGPVLKSERIVGTSTDGARSWDFHQVHILDGLTVRACLVGRDFGADLPQQGEVVLAEVEVSTRRNQRSGAYEVSTTLLRRADPDALDAAPVAGRAA